jgi:hypothetical protein
MRAEVLMSALVALLGPTMAGVGHAESADGYTITTGEATDDPTAFSIEDRPPSERLAIAVNNPDLVEQCLVVGPPGRYSLAFEGETNDGPERGYLQSGGERRLVWVAIWEEEIRGRMVHHNPLRQLTSAELEGIRGVYLDTWSDEIAADVARLDLKRVCVMTSVLGAISRRVAARIRFLVALNSGPGLRRLRDFGQLVFLRQNIIEDDDFDAAWIAGLTNLQHLQLVTKALANADRLKRLRDLSDLTIRAHKGIEHVDFLRGMPNLRKLHLHGRTDLTPVRELAKLVELDASASEASHLPGVSLPSLRRANLMSTKVSDAEVERFRALNPNAVVLHRWTPQLRARLVGASEVKIDKLAMVRGDRTSSVTVRDAAEVAKLVAAIEIDDPPRFVLGCLPTHMLTFTRLGGPAGGERIYLANGGDVRWEGFPGDAPLTPASLREVRAWMARHEMDWSDCSGKSEKTHPAR